MRRHIGLAQCRWWSSKEGYQLKNVTDLFKNSCNQDIVNSIYKIQVMYSRTSAVACTLEDNDFAENTIKINSTATSSGSFTIGGVCSSKLTLTLTRSGVKKLKLYNAMRKGLCWRVIQWNKVDDAKQSATDYSRNTDGSENTSGKCLLGVFYASGFDNDDYSCDVEAYDGMLAFDKSINSEQLKYMQENKKNISQWCQYFLDRCLGASYSFNFSVDTDLPNRNLEVCISDDREIATYREALGYLTQLVAGFATFTEEGNLRVRGYSYDNASLNTTHKRLMSGKFDGLESEITSFYSSVAGFDYESDIATGSSQINEISLYLQENPFLRGIQGYNAKALDTSILTALSNISNSVVGKRFYGCDIDISNLPYLDLGDSISVSRLVVSEDGSETTVVASNIIVSEINYTGGIGVSLRSNSSTGTSTSTAGSKVGSDTKVKSDSEGDGGFQDFLDDISRTRYETKSVVLPIEYPYFQRRAAGVYAVPMKGNWAYSDSGALLRGYFQLDGLSVVRLPSLADKDDIYAKLDKISNVRYKFSFKDVERAIVLEKAIPYPDVYNSSSVATKEENNDVIFLSGEPDIRLPFESKSRSLSFKLESTYESHSSGSTANTTGWWQGKLNREYQGPSLNPDIEVINRYNQSQRLDDVEEKIRNGEIINASELDVETTSIDIRFRFDNIIKGSYKCNDEIKRGGSVVATNTNAGEIPLGTSATAGFGLHTTDVFRAFQYSTLFSFSYKEMPQGYVVFYNLPEYITFTYTEEIPGDVTTPSDAADRVNDNTRSVEQLTSNVVELQQVASGLVSRCNSMDTTLRKHDEDIDRLWQSIIGMSGQGVDLSGVDEKIKSVSDNIDTLSKDVASVNQRVDTINNEIVAVNQKLGEISDIQTTVNKNTELINTLVSRISSLEKIVAGENPITVESFKLVTTSSTSTAKDVDEINKDSSGIWHLPTSPNVYLRMKSQPEGVTVTFKYHALSSTSETTLGSVRTGTDVICSSAVSPVTSGGGGRVYWAELAYGSFTLKSDEITLMGYTSLKVTLASKADTEDPNKFTVTATGTNGAVGQGVGTGKYRYKFEYGSNSSNTLGLLRDFSDNNVIDVILGSDQVGERTDVYVGCTVDDGVNTYRTTVRVRLT